MKSSLKYLLHGLFLFFIFGINSDITQFPAGFVYVFDNNKKVLDGVPLELMVGWKKDKESSPEQKRFQEQERLKAQASLGNLKAIAQLMEHYYQEKDYLEYFRWLITYTILLQQDLACIKSKKQLADLPLVYFNAKIFDFWNKANDQEVVTAVFEIVEDQIAFIEHMGSHYTLDDLEQYTNAQIAFSEKMLRLSPDISLIYASMIEDPTFSHDLSDFIKNQNQWAECRCFILERYKKISIEKSLDTLKQELATFLNVKIAAL